MAETPGQIIARAHAEAERLGKPAPRTRRDVEALTGTAYYGPDPEMLGLTFKVPVTR